MDLFTQWFFRSLLSAWSVLPVRCHLEPSSLHIPEVFLSLWITENWFIQQHTGNHHRCTGWSSEVASINHREPQALINSDTQKNSKTKRLFGFFFLITHLMAKPDPKWCAAIYCLYFSHLMWTVIHFAAEKLIGLIMEHSPRLHQGYYIIYSRCNLFPFKNIKTYQTLKHIWPQGLWMMDCGHAFIISMGQL